MVGQLTPSFRRRWQFFQYKCGPGIVGRSALSAWNLAKAEVWKEEQEADGLLRIRWVDDPEPYEWDCGEPDCEVYGCVVEFRSEGAANECHHGSPDWCDCPHWGHAKSLWGIAEPDDNYRRLVEAQLCLEITPDEVPH